MVFHHFVKMVNFFPNVCTPNVQHLRCWSSQLEKFEAWHNSGKTRGEKLLTFRKGENGRHQECTCGSQQLSDLVRCTFPGSFFNRVLSWALDFEFCLLSHFPFPLKKQPTFAAKGLSWPTVRVPEGKHRLGTGRAEIMADWKLQILMKTLVNGNNRDTWVS